MIDTIISNLVMRGISFVCIYCAEIMSHNLTSSLFSFCFLFPLLAGRALSTAGSPPAPRYHHSAVVHNGSMFIFGKAMPTCKWACVSVCLLSGATHCEIVVQSELH